MSAPVKKRLQDNVINKNDDSDETDSSSDESMNNKQVSQEQGMEIQVDFEGRNPQDPDYHGIKTLLQQLFLKAHIDLGNLTDLIITQNYIGSVVKQSNDDQSSDDEDDDDDINDVFGITTVINISDRQNVPCIQQLRDLLRQLANEHATDAINTIIQNLLKNNSASLGLLINERFVNIPAQISVPLLENLLSEMKRAASKNMPFEFTYLILICKLYKTTEKKLSKKSKSMINKANEESNIIWSNPEEEIFAESATANFEFSVEKDSDSGLSGTWTESDEEMMPYRRVLLIEASKLPIIIDNIKSHMSLPPIIIK